MIESWRWYGPELDTVTLAEVCQTGAASVVTALHEIPYGEVWSRDQVSARRGDIESAGLTWKVCESLPVHEDIKRGDGDLTNLFANYRQSLANLAAEGVTTVCYNFMPLLDWTRTELDYPTRTGGTCLRFSATKMAAFELHILEREAARDDYSAEVCDGATRWFNQATDAERSSVTNAVMAGMPGAFDRYDVEGLRGAISKYHGMTRSDLQANLSRFLGEVIPAAAELGVSLCVHPDDPPRDILGLPRIVSTRTDIEWILGQVDHPSNGLTLCTGSLGAHPANDLPEIARRFALRTAFAHLRNVRKEPDGSFCEADHLNGDVDLVAVLRGLKSESLRREASGDTRLPTLHFRPDHGHVLLSDFDADFIAGYPLIGRMKGLAELRGVLAAI